MRSFPAASPLCIRATFQIIFFNAILFLSTSTEICQYSDAPAVRSGQAFDAAIKTSFGMSSSDTRGLSKFYSPFQLPASAYLWRRQGMARVVWPFHPFGDLSSHLPALASLVPHNHCYCRYVRSQPAKRVYQMKHLFPDPFQLNWNRE